MAVAELPNILQDILDCRSDDVPRLTKVLENLVLKLKQPSYSKSLNEQSEHARFLLIKRTVQTYCNALSSAKLARALNKVLNTLPESCSAIIAEEIGNVVQECVESTSISGLKTLSALLDQNAVAKTAARNHFPSLSDLLKRAVSNARNQRITKNTLEDVEYTHLAIKLCVQVLQVYPQSIGPVLAIIAAGDTPNTGEETLDKVVDLVQLWKDIILSLLTLLIMGSCRDDVLLTGTALSMVFNLLPTFSMSQSAFLDMISLLIGDKTVFYLGRHIMCDATQIVLDAPKDLSLPLIAIIKGLLVCCQKEKLYRGNPSLLLQVYGHVVTLCRGPAVHHYLAFHLMSLWYQKLEQEEKHQLSSVATLSDSSGKERDRMESDLSVTSNAWENRNQTNTDSELLEPEIDLLTCKESGQVIQQGNPSSQTKKTLQLDTVGESELGQEKNLNDGHSVHDKDSKTVMARACPVLSSTLSCLWLNWDSPVDGVSEFVIETFSCLLRVWYHYVRTGISDYGELCEHLIDRVLSMAWHARTRYRPLSLLLPYVDCFKLHQEHPELKEDLLRCMKTNHLAAIASDVYKAFLQQLAVCDESSAIRSWTRIWLPALLKGLSSTDSLQRLKTCTYWLPPTFKIISGSHMVLLNTLAQQLSSSDTQGYYQWLFAWITVSRTVRELMHSGNSCEAANLLEEALFCDEEEIRGQAVMFLCSSVKKAEPMTKNEAALLRRFIPVNLKTDSAPFRQNMTSAIRKMAVRIRDSCLSVVRSKKTGDEYLENSLAFIDWLYNLLIMSLGCGGSYQRRQTTFDLLSALLETLIYQKHDTSKKGKAPEGSHILLLHAQSQGVWNFFNDENFLTILICLEDGADEIQNQAYNLLLKFFEWPQTICHSSSLSKTAVSDEDMAVSPATETYTSILARSNTVLHIISRAFSLVTSPKAYENHSGLLMMSLILNKYVMDLGITFSSSQLDEAKTLGDLKLAHQSLDISDSGSCGKKSFSNAALAFLDLLIMKVKVSTEAVQDNLGASFKHHPIHGLTQCITRCLQDVTKKQRKNEMDWKDGWRSQLEAIITLNQEIISHMLEVLAGKKSVGQENCPSFAEMGVALESLLSEDQEQEEDMASLSPEFQLLLSWCWLNLRESSSCLGEVTSAAVESNGNCQLSADVLTSMGQTFVKILTSCRHRGAIEGCRSGLLQFCSTLMSTGSASFAHIPKAILQQILDSLSENSLTSSVTRRSAGLPIIIQTVIQAAWKCGITDLLLLTVEQLYSIASQPLPTDHSQLQDLSQSHALNILKVIFCDASLAPHLMPLLSRITILVIEGFDSPSWAIRNAATQLISTLVTRIFGQKNKVDNSNSMTLEEFGGQYPELLHFVCDKLTAYQESQNAIRPSLYLILTLLSALGMAPSHQHSLSCRGLLHSAVLSFLSNPVFSLRKLSAQAYVALSPLDATDTTLKQILDKIGQRLQKIQINELHGWLLSASIVMSTGAVSKDSSRELLMFVVDNPWLLFGFQSCLLPLSTVLQLIQRALASSELDDRILEKLWQMMKELILSIKESKQSLQMDREYCLAQGIDTLTAIYHAHSSPSHNLIPTFQQLLQDNLSSVLDDMRGAVINCLHNDTVLVLNVTMQKALLDSLLMETNMSNFIQSVDIFVMLALKDKLCIPLDDLLTFNSANLIKQWRQAHRVQAAIFALEGIIFAACKSEEMEGRCESLQRWCKQLLSFSDPTANEGLRITAAQSLCIAGRNILECCSTRRTIAGVDDIVYSVIHASLWLLEDAEEDVRHGGATFISQLQDLSLRHYYLCYSILSQYISEGMSWCGGIVSLLLEMLYHPGHMSDSISSALSVRSQTLFEPETSSAMGEGVISKLWAYDTLKAVMEHGTQGDPTHALHDAVIFACDELKTQMSVIEDSLSSKPIFNISTAPKVMECLLGLVLLGHLCAKKTDTAQMQDSGIEDRFIQLITKLQQNPSLHPLLRDKYFQTSPSQFCSLLPST